MLPFLVAAFIICYTIFINFRPGVIPGPLHLPVLGMVFQLGWLNLKYCTYEILTKLSEKHGPVYRICGGAIKSVVMTDINIMKEAMASDDWESRPVNKYMATRSFDKDLGILFGNGNKWREGRRFTIRTLKHLGFGRTTVMEDIICEELEQIYRVIDGHNGDVGKPADIDIHGFFNSSTFNMIWFMLVGQKVERDDVKLKRMCEVVEEVTLNVPLASNKFIFFPFLRNVLPGGDVLRKTHRVLYSIIEDIVADMRKDRKYLNEQDNFFGSYLNEIDRRKETNSYPGCFFDQEFIMTVIDLIMAGFETAAHALEAGILALMLHPEVQKKVQAEVDTVVGITRQPNFADIKSMPYTHAMLMELLRICPAIPINVRYTHRETRVGKYTVPADCIGLFNIWGCHMDSRTWVKPREFKPERFLDENMKVVNLDKIVPFGFGKRLCPGETVAKAVMFTFLAGLMQRYTIMESPGKPASHAWLQYRNGFSLSLPPFKASLGSAAALDTTCFGVFTLLVTFTCSRGLLR